MGYETDERLKCYLDTNQLHREQMCLAVLALDKRFAEVRPRHPRGGPDGGRDIEAKYRGELLTYGAVGFVNQAADTEEKRKVVRDKFLSDMASAISGVPSPSAFVFMTNVNLTASEKRELTDAARSKGLIECEVFDRERLRIILDSPDGLAARFQYLGIALSEAEQASFFAKWGDDINSVIATGFQKVQSTLDHLLFLQEARAPILFFRVLCELDRKYSAEEIGHFRAFCSLWLKEPKLNILSILFGASDKSNRFRQDLTGREVEPEGIRHGIGAGQWVQYVIPAREGVEDDEEVPERFEQVGSSSAVGLGTAESITFEYWSSSFIRCEPVLALQDFDDCMFLLMMNKSLATRVHRVHIMSNGYKLLELERSDIAVDESSFESDIPATFSVQECADQWVRIRPASGASAFRLDFFEEVPMRMFSPRIVSAKRQGLLR